MVYTFLLIAASIRSLISKMVFDVFFFWGGSTFALTEEEICHIGDHSCARVGHFPVLMHVFKESIGLLITALAGRLVLRDHMAKIQHRHTLLLMLACRLKVIIQGLEPSSSSSMGC